MAKKRRSASRTVGVKGYTRVVKGRRVRVKGYRRKK
jgi:hypothetical protein